jgi:hypothetical protein
MHTVAQTKPFVAAAREAGLTEEEIDDVVSYLAENPLAGDEIAGTGGCRKVRIAGRGKGESGGYRTITFYSGEAMPIFLLTVFSKGEKSTLTGKEKAALKAITKDIVAAYKEKVSSLAKHKGLAG